MSLHTVSPCTLIISVYKNVDNLRCILSAIELQSTRPNEIIISEDGQDPAMAQFCQSIQIEGSRILHLTQEDSGFRKNRALNRAVCASSNDSLVLIDGDCVPHLRFIEEHLSALKRGIITTGRRVELGKHSSRLLLKRFWFYFFLTNRLLYLITIPFLILDKTKSIESGIYSRFLSLLNRNKKRGVLGCNFGVCKDDILSVNGFNEDYVSPGIGEDADIELRLRHHGIKVINLKFSCIEYHLDHPRTYTISTRNKEILTETIHNLSNRPKNGINTHKCTHD